MMRSPFKRLKLAACLCLLAQLLVSPACVHVEKEKKPAAKANLFISRGAQETTLQWESQPGIFYTVMAKPRNSRSGTWAPLPEARNIPGTGTTMRFVDHPRRGLEKSYRLQMLPATRSKR